MHALITGASAGIGREFAEVLAANGHSLALVARNREQLLTHAKALEDRHKIAVQVVAKDLSHPQAPAEIFDELKNFPVSMLINNAGFGVFGRFADTDLQQELQMLQVNLLALAALTKLFLKPMLQRRAGRILNVASTAAFQPGPWLSLYYASKAAVFSFSCALTLELRGSGVTVTTLCPGGTQTEFQQRAGMEQARRFNSWLLAPMTARSVAEIGYRAMMKGRPVVVAGWKNKLMAAVSKRMRDLWAGSLAGRLNAKRA
jgi:short-subunit dehydrogenase